MIVTVDINKLWRPSDDSGAPSTACTHPLVEILSVNGRNLDNAVRRCAFCGANLPREEK